MQLAAEVESTQGTVAVGLIHAYGRIAMHGSEGFRAELATVACLFSDAPDRRAAEFENERREAAEEYGVPCISLQAAISLGFIQEMGVETTAVKQLAAWMASGMPRSRDPLTRSEMRIARLLVQGMTTVDIAESIGLNQRAVDFHIHRIVVNTGSRSPAELASWLKRHDR